MGDTKLKVGSSVFVPSKNVEGKVAFIGNTHFSAGKWVGVVLSEPLGKNNGTVQGRRYFECEENHGLFVRPSQVAVRGLDGLYSVMNTSMSSEVSESGSLRTFRSSMTTASHAKVSIKPPFGGSKTNLAPSAVKLSHSRTILSQDDLAKSEIHNRTPHSQLSSTPPPPSKLLRRTSLSQAVSGDSASEALRSGIPRPTEVYKPPQAAASLPQTQGPSAVFSVTPPVLPNPSRTVEESASSEVSVELANLRAEVKDLSERLEVMRARRAEDRDKLKEAESLKIQLVQLEENRKLIQEKSAELQRELAMTKNMMAEKQAAFDRYKEEMSDAADTIEMATLDKEMAEEKLETANMEIESLKERVEELTLENQILKEEQANTPLVAGDETTAPGPTLAHLKQLEQQNERLKEGLVKFRDLANEDKQKIAELSKVNATLESQVTHLSSEKMRLSDELKQAQEHTIELKEQVDAALGADQMVSRLTQQNLELEEAVNNLAEERNDLEALCEMNDQLLESEHERQRELAEQVELAQAQIRELVRQFEAGRERIADYEQTISKFREVVTQLQTQNTQLTQALADTRRSAASGSSASLANMVVESQSAAAATAAEASALMAGGEKEVDVQTVAKVIEMELRKLDAEQGSLHVEWLCTFLPDSFNRRAGDHDAILILLLVNRLIFKCELLATQVRKRFPLPSFIHGLDVANSVSPTLLPKSTSQMPAQVKFMTGGDKMDELDVFKTQAELASFTTFLVLMLHYWQGLLHQLKSVLSSCHLKRFSKLVTLYWDISGHEEILDRLLEMCKRDQLDEAVSLENLLSSVSFFVNVHTVHVAPVLQAISTCPGGDGTAAAAAVMNTTEIMADFARITLAASEAVLVDATCLAAFTGQALEAEDCEAGDKAARDESGLACLVSHLGRLGAALRAQARVIRRRLPGNAATQPLCFPPSLAACLDLALHKLIICARCLYASTKSTGQLVATQMAEHTALNSNVVLRECLSPAVQAVLAETDMASTIGSSTPAETCLSILLEAAVNQVSKTATAMEHGEYDFDGSRRPKAQEPITQRAIAYRHAQSELESYRGKLELKEVELQELRRELKALVDEISEKNVRIDMTEKKLETYGRGNLEKIVDLENKLQKALSQQKQTERDHEQALDGLKKHLESVEIENRELRDKLRKSGNSPEGTVTTARNLTIMVMQEIETLRETLRYQSSEITKLRGCKFHEQVISLRPLHVPRRPWEERVTGKDDKESERAQTEEANLLPSSLTELTHRVKQAVNSYYNVLATTNLVRLQPSNKLRDSPEAQLARQSERLLQAKRDLEKAQANVLAYLQTRQGYGVLKTDLATFGTKRMAHRLGLDTTPDPQRLLCRITFPKTAKITMPSGHGLKNALRVSSEQLRGIISAVALASD